jgi:Sugar phosphate isomerases/epimerases
MSFTRCFSTLGCPDLGLEEVFALAARHGIEGVELRALGGSVDLAAYFAREFGTPETLAAHVRGRSPRIMAIDTSLHLVGATAAERAQVEGLAPWADALGVRWMRAFDGGGKADEKEIAEAKATLDAWTEQRRRNGWKVELMVETHDSLFSSAAIGRLVAAVPEVGILWDSHHTWKRSGEDPVATWRAIQRHVVHVHVKDSVSVPSARHPYTYVLPGEGEFPMAGLRETLAAEFGGPVSLEWEKLWHPDLAPLERALEAGAARRWW